MLDPNKIQREGLAEELDNYLRRRFKYKRPFTKAHSDGRIAAYRKRCDIYLRYRPHWFWPYGTLVVARLGFQRTRAGHGTDFLRFLVEKATPFEYRVIALEQASPDASAFAEKFGFEQYAQSERQWVCSIPDLKQALDRRADLSPPT